MLLLQSYRAPNEDEALQGDVGFRGLREFSEAKKITERSCRFLTSNERKFSTIHAAVLVK